MRSGLETSTTHPPPLRSRRARSNASATPIPSASSAAAYAGPMPMWVERPESAEPGLGDVDVESSRSCCSARASPATRTGTPDTRRSSNGQSFGVGASRSVAPRGGSGRSHTPGGRTSPGVSVCKATLTLTPPPSARPQRPSLSGRRLEPPLRLHPEQRREPRVGGTCALWQPSTTAARSAELEVPASTLLSRSVGKAHHAAD